MYVGYTISRDTGRCHVGKHVADSLLSVGGYMLVCSSVICVYLEKRGQGLRASVGGLPAVPEHVTAHVPPNERPRPTL